MLCSAMVAIILQCIDVSSTLNSTVCQLSLKMGKKKEKEKGIPSLADSAQRTK